MARGVEKVEFDALPAAGLVIHGYRVRLDGDPAFAFKVHGIEELILLLPLRNRLGALKETIGKGRLPMIDVGDDGEVPGQFDGHPIRETIVAGDLCPPGGRRCEGRKRDFSPIARKMK